MDVTSDEGALSDDYLDGDGLEDFYSGPIHEDASQHTFAHTTFDAYFALNHKPPRTSANVFSDVLTPLNAQEYSYSIASSLLAHSAQIPWLETNYRCKLFPRLLFELDQGFNLLFYGAGSKRQFLNTLAIHLNAKGHEVLVVNAFIPSFTIKDLLTSIENIPALQVHPMPASSSVDDQLRRIQNFLSSSDVEFDIFVIVHNVDAPALRNARAKSCLAVLAAYSRIHLLASVDNVAFPNLWTLTDIFTRKSDRSISIGARTTPSPGFAWLFHDITTLTPYDFETAYADRSSIDGGSQATRPSRVQKDIPGMSTATVLTEEAARHILLSVTQKAKKLFVLLGLKQLEAMGELELAQMNPKQLAFDYNMLFNIARDDFIATNDTALRALMGEFKDHGLMVSIRLESSGAEGSWIPLRKEALSRIVTDLQKEQ